jgi:hypothetical protein
LLTNNIIYSPLLPGVPLMFVTFYMHEKYEDAIDDFIDRALSKFDRLKADAMGKFLRHK